MDISRIALARVRAEATIRNLRNINMLQVDLDDYEAEEEKYQQICIFFYLKRGIMRKLRSSVAPGGRIIYKTYNTAYLDIMPEFNVKFLLKPGELHMMFAEWDIQHYEESNHISELVAIKPEKTE